MPRKKKQSRRISNEDALTDRFEKALPYYKARGGVVFVSYCRFWEQHGFVQQSLANYLSEHHVPVTWLDSAGWRSYKPIVSNSSPHLIVRQIHRLPGERITPLRSLSVQVQVLDIRREISHHGGNPVLWVQAGLEQGMAEALPYVDVFSTFDDPYRHPSNDPLCEKARLVICQNQYTDTLLKSIPPERRICLLPPVDLRDEIFEKTTFQLPKAFPKKVMGYIGTFRSDGFDLFLLEYFVRHLPDWGFLVMGRTNASGLVVVDRLKNYTNFLTVPWGSRATLAGIWGKIKVSLLLYRSHPSQDGAFPVKIVEGLKFGVPAVGTQVNKTRDISDFFPCTSFADQLVEMAVKTAGMPVENIQKAFVHFRDATDPRLQLSTVAERLSASGRSRFVASV